MIYALRSPQTKLEDRTSISQQIQQAARSGDWSALDDDPLVVYVRERAFLEGYCIYCNTAVVEWGSVRFMHNHHRGGIKQELCKQVAKCLGMTPIYF